MKSYKGWYRGAKSSSHSGLFAHKKTGPVLAPMAVSISSLKKPINIKKINLSAHRSMFPVKRNLTLPASDISKII